MSEVNFLKSDRPSKTMKTIFLKKEIFISKIYKYL